MRIGLPFINSPNTRGVLLISQGPLVLLIFVICEMLLFIKCLIVRMTEKMCGIIVIEWRQLLDKFWLMLPLSSAMKPCQLYFHPCLLIVILAYVKVLICSMSGCIRVGKVLLSIEKSKDQILVETFYLYLLYRLVNGKIMFLEGEPSWLSVESQSLNLLFVQTST